MSKLLNLPEQSIIDGFKGTLDFYILRLNPSDEAGMVCCRTWPRYNPEAYSGESKIMQPYFAYINQMAPFISQEIKDSYTAMAAGTGLSWKDMMVRCYLNMELL